jgi:DNA-binding GntR family transcriptional regulator
MVRSAVPPWRQVADDLRRRIESGEFPPGSPMPSLSALEEQYKVSRTTARKAVGALRDAGLVESVRGWGTFVSEKRSPA